jgi:endonuclease-3
MQLKARYRAIIGYFTEVMPDPVTELEYKDPFSLLVAVILSAQCTDKRVNMITPALLRAFPDPFSMSKATEEGIFPFIKSCSYPNNKAKHLAGMSKVLTEKFGGIVPDDPEVLRELPGVGRKTANVIASVVFGKPVMAVDTHVFRVAARIGLTTGAKTALECELKLTSNIPADLMHKAHHWLILHGRYTCLARKPLCGKCGIKNFCRYYATKNKYEKKPSD